MQQTLAILSDIHGNLEALESVLLSLKIDNPDVIICLGDIIGYGPDPNQCISKLMELKNIYFLKGNHEDIWLGNIGIENCSDIAKQSALWTKNILSNEYKPFIEKFREELVLSGCSFYHSAPLSKGFYPYLNNLADILGSFSNSINQVSFYGHTHRPRITEKGSNYVKDNAILETTSLVLKEDINYYINVGSVGQQRDSKTDASYAIFKIKDNMKMLEIKRIPYNHYLTYSKIRNTIGNIDIANYLIREPERRKFYEDTFNRG